MNRKDIKLLQQQLNAQGFGPLVEDGIYGPNTATAYQRYLDINTSMEVTPAPPPTKPWWTSRAIIGAVITILLSVSGYFIDVSSISATDATDAVVSILTGLAGILSLYGSIKRQNAIDNTLVVPGVRFNNKRLHLEGLSSRHNETKSGSGGDGFPGGPFWDT